MNTREATEIAKGFLMRSGKSELLADLQNHFAAKGYLECYEQVKPLIEALEKISKVTQFDHPKSQIIGSEEYEGAWLDCVEIASEAIKKWNEAQKEGK